MNDNLSPLANLEAILKTKMSEYATGSEDIEKFVTDSDLGYDLIYAALEGELNAVIYEDDETAALSAELGVSEPDFVEQEDFFAALDVAVAEYFNTEERKRGIFL